MTSRKKSGLIMAVVLSLTPLIPDRAVLAADLKEAVEQLSVQLSKSLPEGRTLRVAVRSSLLWVMGVGSRRRRAGTG